MGTNKDMGGAREVALVVGLALAGVVVALVLVVSPWGVPAQVSPVVSVVVPALTGTEQ
jgi:hypothetical protein